MKKGEPRARLFKLKQFYFRHQRVSCASHLLNYPALHIGERLPLGVAAHGCGLAIHAVTRFVSGEGGVTFAHYRHKSLANSNSFFRVLVLLEYAR